MSADPSRLREDSEDDALAARAASGQDAFDELYSRYVRKVYAYALSILGSSLDAEDATQEVFSRMWTSLPRYRGGNRFWPWLRGIARHVVSDYRRRKRLRDALEGLLATLSRKSSGGKTPFEPPGESVLMQWFMREGKRLTPGRREALWWRVIEEKSVSETASIMGISQAAVKMACSRGLRDLRKRWPTEWREGYDAT